jgi:hypothetical protein
LSRVFQKWCFKSRHDLVPTQSGRWGGNTNLTIRGWSAKISERPSMEEVSDVLLKEIIDITDEEVLDIMDASREVRISTL